MKHLGTGRQSRTLDDGAKPAATARHGSVSAGFFDSLSFDFFAIASHILIDPRLEPEREDHHESLQVRVFKVFVVTFLVSIVGVLTSCQCSAATGTGNARLQAIERGRYLVTALACADCHTPMKLGPNGPEPDLSRNLSGHPEGFQMGPPPALGEGG